MLFRNKGSPVQVRLKDNGGYKWEDVKTGETIELPEDVGIRYGFEKVIESMQKVTEGKIGKTKVETKQFEDFSKIKVPEFEKELTKIKGIGAKTAGDITKVFPTEQDLRIAILNGEELPFYDNIEEKLRRKYGKKN